MPSPTRSSSKSSLRWLVVAVMLVALAAIVGVIVYQPDSGQTTTPTDLQAKADWLNEAYVDISQRMDRRDFIGAEQHAREILQKYPEEAEAWMALSQLYIAQNQEEAAYGYILRALDFDPDSPEKNHTAGVLAMRLGQLDAAYASHSRSVALAPDRPLFLMNLGESLRRLGRLDEAERTLNDSLRLNPSMDEAHAALASIYIARGDRDTALKHLVSAVQFARSTPQKRLTYLTAEAQLLRQMGRAKDAAAILEAMDIYDWNEQIVVELAACYVAMGDRLAAADAWYRYWDIEPGTKSSAARAGLYFFAAGDMKMATEMWVASSGSRHPDAVRLDEMIRTLPPTRSSTVKVPDEPQAN